MNSSSYKKSNALAGFLLYPIGAVMTVMGLFNEPETEWQSVATGIGFLIIGNIFLGRSRLGSTGREKLSSTSRDRIS